MSERRGAAADQAAKAGAAKRTAGRRKPAPRGGSKPAAGPAPAKQAGSAAGRREEPAESAEAQAPRSPLSAPGADQQPQDRGLRRAIFLAELAEAKELRRRVAPRRARAAELHARLLRTFRY